MLHLRTFAIRGHPAPLFIRSLAMRLAKTTPSLTCWVPGRLANKERGHAPNEAGHPMVLAARECKHSLYLVAYLRKKKNCVVYWVATSREVLPRLTKVKSHMSSSCSLARISVL